MMKDNLEINGDLYGVGVVQGGVINQNLILPEHKTLPQLTSKLGKDTIIGRVKELQEIDTLLKESNSLLLINGIGGIGKSTIASYYLHSQKDKLDYYGFFEGLKSFTSELREPLALKEGKENNAFMEALSKLRKLKGNKLLIFDDVKEIEENQDKIEKILALKDSGYKILLTSREEIEDIKQYYLDVLSLVDAKELFNSIYQVEDEVLLEEILGYLDCHAFFVEMTAKILKNKKTLTPEIIKEKFKNGEFSTIQRKRKESFDNYLNKLFSVSFDKLDTEEILMLKQLSILPSIEIEFSFLQEIFDKQEDEEFEDILNYLCEKGWLNYSNEGYKLHQIIVNYIQLKEKILLKDVETIIDFFTLFISTSTENLLMKKNYAIFIDTVYKIFEKDIENKKIYDFIFSSANFFQVLGVLKKSESIYLSILNQIEKIDEKSIFNVYSSISVLYDLLGEYNQAELYSNKAINYIDMNNEEYIIEIITIKTSLAKIYTQQGKYFLAEKIFLDILNSLAIEFDVEDDVIEHFNIYHSIGILYQSLGKYTLSETYLLKSLKVREYKLDSEPIRVGKIYNTLGYFYYTIQDFKKSEKFHLQALSIREKFLGINHAETSTTYNNLGLLYTVFAPKKALDYLFKSLKIREDNLGLMHVRTATIYQNLADFYMMNDKQYLKAISFYKKALNIKKNKLDKFHPEIAFLYRSIALSYFLNKKYMEARKNINKSLQIGREALSLEHPEFVGIQDVYKLINNQKALLLKPKTNNYNSKIGRNDKVIVEYLNGTIKKGKYKKFIADILEKKCTFIK